MTAQNFQKQDRSRSTDLCPAFSEGSLRTTAAPTPNARLGAILFAIKLIAGFSFVLDSNGAANHEARLGGGTARLREVPEAGADEDQLICFSLGCGSSSLSLWVIMFIFERVAAVPACLYLYDGSSVCESNRTRSLGDTYRPREKPASESGRQFGFFSIHVRVAPLVHLSHF